jgi:transcriptional regulator with XRE-family HTH domain
MSLKDWENKVLSSPGAGGRVAAIEDELRLAAGLTALREEAGLSQRELAKRIGVSQPRVAAIERSQNITLEVLEEYVDAIGGQLEVNVVRGTQTIPLISARRTREKRPRPKAAAS